MKTSNLIKEMQQAYRDGDRFFHHSNYERSVDCYKKALRLCKSLPEDEGFDGHRFEASVQAGLSASLGRLDKHLESLAAANKALSFYDELGDNYPADIGRWLMALVNQGTALATLGCLPAALEALRHAKEIFNNKGLDAAQNRQWLEMVDGNIAAINAHLKEKEQQEC
jgi:tetratricopeptide (TPR) repeat protein